MTATVVIWSPQCSSRWPDGLWKPSWPTQGRPVVLLQAVGFGLWLRPVHHRSQLGFLPMIVWLHSALQGHVYLLPPICC